MNMYVAHMACGSFSLAGLTQVDLQSLLIHYLVCKPRIQYFMVFGCSNMICYYIAKTEKKTKKCKGVAEVLTCVHDHVRNAATVGDTCACF